MSSLWDSQYKNSASSKFNLRTGINTLVVKTLMDFFYLLKSVSDVEHFGIVRVVFEQLVVFWDRGLLIEPHKERRVAKIGLGNTIPKSWIGKLQKLILCNLNDVEIFLKTKISMISTLSYVLLFYPTTTPPKDGNRNRNFVPPIHALKSHL